MCFLRQKRKFRLLERFFFSLRESACLCFSRNLHTVPEGSRQWSSMPGRLARLTETHRTLPGWEQTQIMMIVIIIIVIFSICNTPVLSCAVHQCCVCVCDKDWRQSKRHLPKLTNSHVISRMFIQIKCQSNVSNKVWFLQWFLPIAWSIST